MGKTVGTPRGYNINNQILSAPEDADITMMLSPFDTTAIATSGETLYKMTIRNPNAEGVPVSVDWDEAEQLRATAELTTDYNLTITMADGTEFKCQGRIKFDNATSADGKATIDFLPNNALRGWEKF